MAQKNTMLTIDNIISNHLSLRNIVGFLDRETALRVSKLWARVKTQQIASVRFLEGGGPMAQVDRVLHSHGQYISPRDVYAVIHNETVAYVGLIYLSKIT